VYVHEFHRRIEFVSIYSGISTTAKVVSYASVSRPTFLPFARVDEMGMLIPKVRRSE